LPGLALGVALREPLFIPVPEVDPCVFVVERVVGPFVVTERWLSGRPVTAGELDALSLLPAEALLPVAEVLDVLDVLPVEPDELPLPPPPEEACARWIGAASAAMAGAPKQTASAATRAVRAGKRVFIVGLLKRRSVAKGSRPMTDRFCAGMGAAEVGRLRPLL
jgi:hypothetical protein